MCVACSTNKCRIRESDLQAACLYIIFLNWYNEAASCRQYRYSEMQEKVTQNCILQRRRLGCQTQRFRRLVDLLGFQSNLPAVSLFYAFHYSTARRDNEVRLFFWIGIIQTPSLNLSQNSIFVAPVKVLAV